MRKSRDIIFTVKKLPWGNNHRSGRRWGWRKGKRRGAPIPTGTIPLSQTSPELLVEVVSLNLPPRLSIRMSELGLIPGNRVKVIMNQMGYVVIETLGSRYGLNPRITSNIYVKPLDSDSV